MEKRDNASDDAFAHHKFILKLFGLRGSQNIFYKIYGIAILIVLTIYVVLVIPEVLKLRNDFDNFVHGSLFEIGEVTGLISGCCIYWNRFKIEQLFQKFEILNDLSNCDISSDGYNFMEKYRNLIRKQSYIGSIAVLFVMIACILVSLVLTDYNEKLALPFGTGPNFNNNNIRYTTNIMSGGVIGFLLIVGIFIYANMLTLLSGHCKLLQIYIKAMMAGSGRNSLQIIEDKKSNNFEILSNNNNDTVVWETFKIQLRKVVPYHVGILETGAEMDNVFCMVILLWFGGLSICMCLYTYHITTVNIQSSLGIRDLLGILIENLLLIVLSVWGEEIQTESGKIASVCYEVDFVGTDLRIQESLLLLMIRAQKPITPTIGKFKILNMNTMLGVLQSIYSYYSILRNLKET